DVRDMPLGESDQWSDEDFEEELEEDSDEEAEEVDSEEEEDEEEGEEDEGEEDAEDDQTAEEGEAPDADDALSAAVGAPGKIAPTADRALPTDSSRNVASTQPAPARPKRNLFDWDPVIAYRIQTHDYINDLHMDYDEFDWYKDHLRKGEPYPKNQ